MTITVLRDIYVYLQDNYFHKIGNAMIHLVFHKTLYIRRSVNIYFLRFYIEDFRKKDTIYTHVLEQLPTKNNWILFFKKLIFIAPKIEIFMFYTSQEAV